MMKGALFTENIDGAEIQHHLARRHLLLVALSGLALHLCNGEAQSGTQLHVLQHTYLVR
jgi:hypothetical protein